jgi:tRNA threonylcarbamoyladenosine biosynthesis protein TsaB
VTLETAAARIAEVYAGGPATFTGSGAPLLEGILAGALIDTPDGPDPVAIARLAAVAPVRPVRPLYLRAPDAKLPI